MDSRNPTAKQNIPYPSCTSHSHGAPWQSTPQPSHPAQTVPKHTRHTYDAHQRSTSTTDPLGRVTRFSYDAQGNRILTLMPLDRRVTQLFEPLFQNVVQSGRILHGVPSTQGGQPLSYTPLNTEFTHDPQGRLTGITNALGQSRSLAYDGSNRVREVTDRKGQRTTVTYTERGLVASLTTADRLGRI